jgi:hypothetical protein
VLGAEAKVRELAMRMNRNALLAERRSRFLLAIRQTYSDFFHDYFIDSSQVFSLRVRSLLPSHHPLYDTGGSGASNSVTANHSACAEADLCQVWLSVADSASAEEQCMLVRAGLRGQGAGQGA